jgi:hypothetical protein
VSCAYSVYSYTLPVPGADSSAYVLFSTLAFSEYFSQQAGNHRVRVDVVHTQSGTFNLYKSRNAGTTWRLVDTQAATASATDSSVFDVLIEPFLDWKIEWANGGAAQAYFEPDVAILPYRVSSAAAAAGGNEIIDNVGGGGTIVDDVGGGGDIQNA